jgi:hypothetical protein
MNLGIYKSDLERGARHLGHDARRFVIDAVSLMARFVTDMKAEAKHVADPSQRASIIERHCGFIAMVPLIGLVLFFGIIAVVLNLHPSH